MIRYLQDKKLSEDSIEHGKLVGKFEAVEYIRKRVNVLMLMHDSYQVVGDVEGAADCLVRVEELTNMIEELTKDVE